MNISDIPLDTYQCSQDSWVQDDYVVTTPGVKVAADSVKVHDLVHHLVHHRGGACSASGSSSGSSSASSSGTSLAHRPSHHLTPHWHIIGHLLTKPNEMTTIHRPVGGTTGFPQAYGLRRHEDKWKGGAPRVYRVFQSGYAPHNRFNNLGNRIVNSLKVRKRLLSDGAGRSYGP